VDCAISDASGYYALAVPAGVYDVTVEAGLYLDGEKLGVADGTTLSKVKLLGGDANDDDCVAVNDLKFIRGKLGTSPGDPGWDPRADINADGVVTNFDLRLAYLNLGTCSPVPWP
jgi:hypothetical protein